MQTNSTVLRMLQYSKGSYQFNYDATVTTQSMVNVGLDGVWLPPPTNIAVQEAIWNSYDAHKLLKVTYRLDNFRLVLTTDVQSSVLATIPARDIATRSLNGYRCFYFKELHASDTVLPVGTAEERMKKLVIRGPKSGFWGQIPVNSARMNSTGPLDHANFSSFYGAYAGDIKLFLKDFQNNTTTSAIGAGAQYTMNFGFMPSDPFPPTWYTTAAGGGTIATCNIDVVFDIRCYTTWRLTKQLQN
jgi:hypothetical protein